MTTALFPALYYRLHRQVQGRRGDFHLYDPDGQVAAFTRHNVGYLHDDIYLWDSDRQDETQAQVKLTLRAHTTPGIYPTYGVFDPRQPGQTVGRLQRLPWRWPPYDTWQVNGADERPLGYLHEAGLFQAGLRLLFWGGVIPQRYELRAAPPGSVGPSANTPPLLARYNQSVNIFQYSLAVHFSQEQAGGLDHRLGIAAAFLLAIGEGFYVYRPFQKPHQPEPAHPHSRVDNPATLQEQR